MGRVVYEPRYTEFGLSIKKLKLEAKRLQQEQGSPLNTALDIVARSAKYSGWAELMSREPNPIRDAFFLDIYANGVKEWPSANLYAEFREKRHLPDDKESFRLFAVKQWENFSKLGFDNLGLIQEPLPPKVLRDELIAVLKVSGTEGLVPRNLSSRLLETMYFVFATSNGNSEILDSKYFEGYYQAVIEAVLLISAYPFEKPEFGLPVEEVCRRCEHYLLWCLLELASRRTRVAVKTPPSAKEIFREDVMVAFKFPDGALDT